MRGHPLSWTGYSQKLHRAHFECVRHARHDARAPHISPPLTCDCSRCSSTRGCRQRGTTEIWSNSRILTLSPQGFRRSYRVNSSLFSLLSFIVRFNQVLYTVSVASLYSHVGLYTHKRCLNGRHQVYPRAQRKGFDKGEGVKLKNSTI